MGLFARILGTMARVEESHTPMLAVWNGEVIARSDHTVLVEGNHYFPPQSVDRAHLQPSEQHSHCPWKGDASYYTITAGGHENDAAAWYYPEPFDAAEGIRDHVAFWKGVEVQPA